VVEIGCVDDFYFVMYSDGGDSDTPLHRLQYIDASGRINEYVLHGGNEIIPYGRGYTSWTYPGWEKDPSIAHEILPEHRDLDGDDLMEVFKECNFEYDLEDEVKLIFRKAK
jgi:hypothetical protein